MVRCLSPFLLAALLGAADDTLHVALDGDDAWSGRLPAANATRTDGPFRTLAKAVAATRAGQTCLIRAGVWREILKPVHDGDQDRPAVFRAYPGEQPVLCGADPLAGWTTAGGDGAWSAPMTWDLADQNQLFCDGQPLVEARWPDHAGDPLHTPRAQATGGTATNLTDPNLPDRDWRGATLWCAGGDQWIAWVQTITGWDAGTKTITGDKPQQERFYQTRKGSPYVLMGVRAALDAPGEWWFDRAAKRVLLIPPAGMTPQTMVVEAKRRTVVLDLSGRSHVRIEGLHLRGGGMTSDDRTTGVILSRITGVWLAHSYLKDVAGGVVIRGTGNTVERCDLGWSSTSVLEVAGSDHRIVNNHLHDGGYGAKWKGAVSLTGRRILFSHNTAKGSGRDLVSIHGLMESCIQYNDLSDAGWLTRDLGMTYGHNTDFMNTIIHHNRVHDNRAGHCAMGIYFDHCSHNVIVHHNVVWNADYDPLRVNNPSYGDVITNNTCFNTGRMTTFDHSKRDDCFGMRVQNNLLNQEPKLPAHVVQEGNRAAKDPGYRNPAGADFTVPEDTPGAVAIAGITGGKPHRGAFPPGVPAWTAGHDFNRAIVAERLVADVDGMNLIRNACFELPTLECWTATGTAKLVPGNNWGNPIAGGTRVVEPTGTSKRQLCLTKGRATVEQAVAGLHPATDQLLSGWVKLSSENESARIGIRRADGTMAWSDACHATAWTRLLMPFSTGAGETAVTVVIEKASDGGGEAWADNLLLQRMPKGWRRPTAKP